MVEVCRPRSSESERCCLCNLIKPEPAGIHFGPLPDRLSPTHTDYLSSNNGTRESLRSNTGTSNTSGVQIMENQVFGAVSARTWPVKVEIVERQIEQLLVDQYAGYAYM